MSRILDQQYEEKVPIGKLKLHPENPRKGNTDQIARSINANGFYGAVVVQKSTGYILAGNHRYLAAKGEGLEHIPVFYVDVSDAEGRKILAADNRTSDLGGYDNEALTALLSSIQSDSGTLEGTGYDQSAFDEIVETAANVILSEAKERVAAMRPATSEEHAKPELGEGFEYRVIVLCENELHQTEVLERLEAEGLKCKPLIS